MLFMCAENDLKMIDSSSKIPNNFLSGIPKFGWALPDDFLWWNLLELFDQRLARAAQRINVGQTRQGADIGASALVDSTVSSIFGPI